MKAGPDVARQWAWNNMIRKNDEWYGMREIYNYLHRHKAKYVEFLKENKYEPTLYDRTL